MNPIVRNLIAALLVVALSACARPAKEKKSDDNAGRHEYRDLKAEVYPVPAPVKAALPGLQNDNIYLYREIAPTLNLVAYVPDYSRDSALRMCAQAFIGLADEPEFRRDISFWIIQAQPEPEKNPAPDSKPGPVLVWGVRPEEVDAYRSSNDLTAFVRDSEYLLVDDRIIDKGAARLAEFTVVSAPAPVEGTTAAPEPEAGATTAAPEPPPGPPPLVPPPGTEITIPREAVSPAPGAPPAPVPPE